MSQLEKSKQFFVHFHSSNTKNRITVTIKLVCDKDIAAAAEYSQSISESDLSAYQERRQSLAILITQAKNI